MKHKFDSIISKYKNKIYRTCLAFSNPVDAEDIFQEVCINIWLGMDSFKEQSQMSTWIYRITVNTCLLFIRKNKQKKEVDLDTLGDLSDENLNSNECNERDLLLLRNFILTLPGKERIIMILYLEDLTYSEISDIIGLSTNYIGVKINRIKKN